MKSKILAEHPELAEFSRAPPQPLAEAGSSEA
jgi:hypothetical protein